MSITMSSMSSTLFRAEKVTRPISSAIALVANGAENFTGVASKDTPAVMPNQVNEIHAGFVMVRFRRGNTGFSMAGFLSFGGASWRVVIAGAITEGRL
jgi:hypothetical protein